MAKPITPTKTGATPQMRGISNAQANGPAAMQSQPQTPPPSADLSERVPTGIEGLDDLCEGGFERGSSVLALGEPGSGKTTMMTQFLVNGALNHGEGGVFLSFEETKESIIRHSASFGWDLNALEKQGAVAIINYKPHEVKRLAEEGGGLIWDTISSIGAKRLAIDSLTSYAMLFESLYQAREAELLLFELLRKWKCTTLLSAEGINTEKMRITTGMEYLSDGVILLHHPRYQSGRYRAIEILKMRGCKHSEKLCPYEFVEGEGIRVHPGETIFYDVNEQE